MKWKPPRRGLQRAHVEVGMPPPAPNVAAFIQRVLAEGHAIMEAYEDDGDWYGCVKNGLAFLAEAGRSEPPKDQIYPGSNGKFRRNP